MSRYFIHPVIGYFETTSEVSIDRYPQGTIAVPQRPSPAHEWVDSAWVEGEPEPEQLPPLTPKQWLYGLRRFGIKAGVDATIATLSGGDAAAAAALEANVYGSQFYVFEDTLQLLAAYAEALPPEIAAIDEEALTGMWQTVLSEMP